MVESVLHAAKYVLPIAVTLLSTIWCVVYMHRRDETDYRVLDFIRYGCIVCSACTLCLYTWESSVEWSVEDITLSLVWLATLTIWTVLGNHGEDEHHE